MSLKGDMNKLVREKRAEGWIIEPSAKHLRWKAPNGEFFFTAKTPGDYRNLANIKALIKRAVRGSSDAQPSRFRYN